MPLRWCHILKKDEKKSEIDLIKKHIKIHLSASPQDLVYLLSPLLTCADVHHMVEGVHALNNVHDQIGEANVVLHDERIYRLGLDHVVHQVEPLGILQAALRQTLIGTFIIYSSTLQG